jgi:hypothetical protein
MFSCPFFQMTNEAQLFCSSSLLTVVTFGPCVNLGLENFVRQVPRVVEKIVEREQIIERVVCKMILSLCLQTVAQVASIIFSGNSRGTHNVAGRPLYRSFPDCAQHTCVLPFLLTTSSRILLTFSLTAGAHAGREARGGSRPR